MNTVRLNITLPKKIAERLKGVENKSAFISEAIEEHTTRIEKERQTKEIREGYKATREEDASITREWESTTGDGID
jgi:hypothetical protein